MNTVAGRELPAWFRLSPAHFNQLLKVLESADLRRLVSSSDPRDNPELVERIVDEVGDALARYGFDSAHEPTPEGRLLEDLVDYFVPHHPTYGDSAPS